MHNTPHNALSIISKLIMIHKQQTKTHERSYIGLLCHVSEILSLWYMMQEKVGACQGYKRQRAARAIFGFMGNHNYYSFGAKLSLVHYFHDCLCVCHIYSHVRVVPVLFS